MKMNRDEFLQTLDVAKMAVTGSDQIEQLGHFIFTGKHVVTFNNRLCVYHPFETEFECSVRSDLFHKQLSRFETPEVDVSLRRKTLTIAGSREKAKLSVTLERDEEIFGILADIRKGQEKSEYMKIPEDFVSAIDFCSFSASRDAADGTLCCVCIDNDKMFSTDNFRVTIYNLSESMGDRIMIDATLAKEIKRFDMTHWAKDKNWIHFKNQKDVVLSARQIFGDYPTPSLEKAFDFDGKRMKLPDNLQNALGFVEVIAGEEQAIDRLAKITLKDGVLTASIERDNESSEKSIDLLERYKDLDFAFHVNVEFLKAILDHTTKITYNIELQRAMFQSKKFRHAIRIMTKEQ